MILARNPIDNQPTTPGTFLRVGNQYELIIPIHFTQQEPIVQTFDGQIVAFATVPEPSTLAKLAGLIAAATAVHLRRSGRARLTAKRQVITGAR